MAPQELAGIHMRTHAASISTLVQGFARFIKELKAPEYKESQVRLHYIDPPFNSNRNYEVFWGDLAEPRAQASGFPVCFEDRHASTQAYIDYMRPRLMGSAANRLNPRGPRSPPPRYTFD
jgi:hypothetical protein